VNVVTSAADLIAALQSQATDIEVRGTISGMPMITLRPGLRLRGGTLRFGAKGVRLTRDNEWHPRHWLPFGRCTRRRERSRFVRHQHHRCPRPRSRPDLTSPTARSTSCRKLENGWQDRES